MANYRSVLRRGLVGLALVAGIAASGLLNTDTAAQQAALLFGVSSGSPKPLAVGADGTVSVSCSSCGATPGGSSGSIQYNNAGALGGFGSWDGSAFSVDSGTLTATHPFLLSQTWNDAGVNFEGFVVDITNTASGGSSRLLTLKRGGVEQIYVTPSGLLGAQTIDSSTDIHAAGDFQLGPNHQYLFSDGSDYGVGLKRDANTILRATDGSSGVADFKFRHLLGGGSAPTVASTTSNSCGTTNPTIDSTSTDTSGEITVGATSGTSCTVTFATAFATRPTCWGTNQTTTPNAVRAPSTTSTVVLLGTFVAGDVISYGCVGR